MCRDLTAASAIYSQARQESVVAAKDRHLRRGRLVLSCQLTIESFVFLSRGRPGKISRHRALHQGPPHFFIFKNLARPLDRVPESFGRIFVAKKTVTAVGGRIVIFDDLLNSAGRARDRQRAVFQIVHRTETGWLEPRRNETDVHSRFEHVRAFFIVTVSISEFARELSRRDGERGFIGRIAFAKNYEPDVIDEEPIEKRHENIETFFANNARDHSKDRPARFGIQFQTAKKRISTKLFPPKLTRCVIRRKKFVRLGIPTPVIGAVQNGAQLVRIFAQDHVQTTTEFRRLDLASMSLAYSRDFVGQENSAFEEVQLSKEFHAAEGEESLVEVREAKIEPPKTSLLGDVMDREHGRKRQTVGAHVNRPIGRAHARTPATTLS